MPKNEQLFNFDRMEEARGERDKRGKGQRAGRDGWRVSGELWRIWATTTGASFGAFNLGRFTGVCSGFWEIVDKSHTGDGKIALYVQINGLK